MSWFYIPVGILGLAILMVVHEGGHLLAARAFGMRVIKFSIGFGPAIWRHQPKGSETVYQVALIPFLAYVQIAGMNPFEEVDPHDKASYANASLIGRITAIAAGPLANYFFASVLFFGASMVGGKEVINPHSTQVDVQRGGPAAAASMQTGDRVLEINGVSVKNDWERMRKQILANPNKPIDVQVERNGKPLHLKMTPKPTGENGGGQISVGPVSKFVPMSFREAAINSVVSPAQVVRYFVIGVSRIVTGKEKPQLTGPVGIVRETSRAAESGGAKFLELLGILSAYLAGFNLVPFPALDGGRLMFLVYEAVTRRRPDARVEAQVHAVGLIMLVALILVVSVFDVKGGMPPR
jgi:regulator of sigma E protease